MESDDRVKAGTAFYTPVTLKIYDLWVLGISNRIFWRCPTPGLRALFNRNVTGSHLDIGVGTGFYLDKAVWPVARPHITLCDLNPHSLEAAAARISRYAPEKVCADALQPLPITKRFGSISLCYLLHCMPGTIEDKAVVFDHLQAVLADDGVVFGATIVQGDAPRSRAAQAVMDFYNRKGVFCNARDTYEALKTALSARFSNVRLERAGAVVIFEARR